MRTIARTLLRRAVARSPRFRALLAGLLGRHLTTLDLDFLRALPDGLLVDLDRQLDLDRKEPGTPTLLWSILWEASASGRLEPGFLKRVDYRLGGKRFAMELDLAQSPECGYLLRNPTVAITRRLLGGGETMLDIGANAGFHALSAGLFFRRVVAFEPTPETASRLERNIALSALPHVSAQRVALSDRVGEARFQVDPAHCGGNRLGGAPSAGTASSIVVPLQTLDGIDASTPLGRVDLIKIDVEGHECEVIAGARRVLERDRPTLIVEFNTPEQFDRFRGLLPDRYRALRDRPDGSTQAITDGHAAFDARDVVFEGRG